MDILTFLQRPEIQKAIQILKPYTDKAYLVGGSVRDLLLGIECNDFDIEVYGIECSLFEDIMKQNDARGAGKQFFVYKIDNIDFSLPRTENKFGETHRSFTVKYCNDEYEASKRRDFTINSLMLNIFTGELKDFHGGLEDIRNGVIRHIDDQKFQEDPLRVLRAIQFSARFGFQIDDKTLNLMKELPLNYLSAERIGVELIKLFNAKDHIEIGMQYMYKLEIFEKLFGITINDMENLCIQKYLKDLRDLELLNEFSLLFLLREIAGLKDRDIINKLRLPKRFNVIWEQPLPLNQSDKDLLTIALQMPLKEWLGLNTYHLVERAQKLGIYDNKFSTQVTPTRLLKEGFSGHALGVELKKRQIKEIEHFILLKST